MTGDGPTARDRALRLVSSYSKPETCKALEVQRLVAELGDSGMADATLRDLWREGLIEPASTEADPEDGALFEVPRPTLEGDLRQTTRFRLSLRGYESVGRLHECDLFLPSDYVPESRQPETLAEEVIYASAYLNAKLMEAIGKDPARMLELNPREFEQFVAALFSRDGFSVQLTPVRKDGGRDILAVRHDHLGEHLYIAECKRYRPDRPVGVQYVRSLYGVLERDQATRGIIATTSHFTAGARGFAEEVKWRLGLKDFDDLAEWLRNWKGTAVVPPNARVPRSFQLLK